MSVLLVALLVFGLMIGSFLNVVIHRVPLGQSLLGPGSACPACSHPVRAYDNIPVVSWLILRGRCRDCEAPISWRYPAVEVATGLLFVAAGLRFGWTPYLASALVVLAAGTALFLIDLEHRRLPFVISGVAAAGTAVALSADAAFNGTSPVLTALLSTAAWLGVYGGIWLAVSEDGRVLDGPKVSAYREQRSKSARVGAALGAARSVAVRKAKRAAQQPKKRASR